MKNEIFKNADSIEDYIKIQQDYPNIYINIVSSEGIEKPNIPEHLELPKDLEKNEI